MGLAILAALFFALSFVINRMMAVGGGPGSGGPAGPRDIDALVHPVADLVRIGKDGDMRLKL